MAIPVYQEQNFLAPQFRIELKGQSLGNEVIRDVLQVSYKDDLESLDAFDFTLYDWDSVELTTKYSSPYDENGQQRTLSGSDEKIPIFEPGARVDLFMGYYGSEEQVLMMSGKVVSAAVSFPASGAPVLTVRVLNLLFDLQKTQESLTFEEKTPTEIAQEIANNLEIELQSEPGEEQTIPFIGMNNEYPIIFLSRLARDQGYDLFVNVENDNEQKLFFGLRETATKEYELEWGKSLIQYTPVLKLKDQKEKVIVRGWDSAESGANRSIEAEATWDDLEINMPDTKLVEQIKESSTGAIEEITDRPVSGQEAALALAKGTLRRIIQGVITGSGSTVGVPELRAGSRLLLKGLGFRYSHNYIVTESTHKIDGNGYTTNFSARMEVVSG